MAWIYRRWHHAVFVAATFAVLALAGFLVNLGFDPAWQTRLGDFPDAIGAMLGPFFGLIALMFGALYNAKLNRDRDDRLREQETRALAAALAADVKRGVSNLNLIKSTIGENDLHMIKDMFFKLNRQPIFEANANRLGLLGEDLCHRLAVFIADLAMEGWTIEQLVKARESGEAHDLDADLIDEEIERAEALLSKLRERAAGRSIN